MRQNMGMMPSSAREIARSPDACGLPSSLPSWPTHPIRVRSFAAP